MIVNMDPGARGECRKRQFRVNFGLYMAGVLVLLSSLVPFLYSQLYFMVGIQFDEPGEFMKRSGATMSILAVAAEIIAVRSRARSDVDNEFPLFEPYSTELVRNASRRPVEITTIAVFIVVLMGIAINSHGDIIYVFGTWPLVWLIPFMIVLPITLFTCFLIRRNKIFNEPWKNAKLY